MRCRALLCFDLPSSGYLILSGVLPRSAYRSTRGHFSHEIDSLRVIFSAADDHIALILAVFIINEDYELSCFYILIISAIFANAIF